MKSRVVFFIFLVTVSLLSVHSSAQTTEIKVLTYNIRYANPDDGLNAWPNRKDKVFSLIKEESPSVFGLQEALIGQIKDVEAAFPGYARIGVGRDDGKEKGEFAPVFFDLKRFKKVKSGTFWLSQTPGIAGSRGWDAACNRIVTWGIFVDKKDGRKFCFFNTHFDHMGDTARRNSALLLRHAVDSIADGLPAVITGDFNASAESEPIRLLTGSQNEKDSFTDSKSIAETVEGPDITYTGFEVGGIAGENIDYIFIKNVQKVLSHKVINRHSGRFYPSDHLPVVSVIRF